MKEGIEGKLRCGERVVGGDPTRRYRTVKALRRQGLQQTYILYLIFAIVKGFIYNFANSSSFQNLYLSVDSID
jgi:hypothetical protein